MLMMTDLWTEDNLNQIPIPAISAMVGSLPNFVQRDNGNQGGDLNG